MIVPLQLNIQERESNMTEFVKFVFSVKLLLGDTFNNVIHNTNSKIGIFYQSILLGHYDQKPGSDSGYWEIKARNLDAKGFLISLAESNKMSESELREYTFEKCKNLIIIFHRDIGNGRGKVFGVGVYRGLDREYILDTTIANHFPLSSDKKSIHMYTAHFRKHYDYVWEIGETPKRAKK